MKILAVNTAGYKGQVLYTDGQRSEMIDCGEGSSSQTLMPAIDHLLKSLNLTINDIDTFGAVTGPGSFTGIRIGVSTVRAFCYALNKPAFAVNNLKLIAYNNLNDKSKVAAFCDVGNMILYCGVYQSGKTIAEPFCLYGRDVNEFLKEHPDALISSDPNSARFFTNANTACSKNEFLSAVNEASRKLISYNELVPLYIRKAQPERGEGDL